MEPVTERVLKRMNTCFVCLKIAVEYATSKHKSATYCKKCEAQGLESIMSMYDAARDEGVFDRVVSAVQLATSNTVNM